MFNRATCQGHTGHVLCVCWSPDGRTVATGSMDKQVILWDADTGKMKGRPLKAHTREIRAIAWDPLHSNPNCDRVASCSKDCTIKIWNTVMGTCVLSLSGHSHAIQCLKWGGEGLLYSASQDRSIKVWEASTGKMCRSLDGHAHWVNTMALQTDYVLRTGAFDHKCEVIADKDKAAAFAKERYLAVTQGKPEKLVSGSDDFTLFLWTPATEKKPLARMTGHVQLVNQVVFSPDGRFIASASFDKSVKLWDGNTGKFVSTLRGHVGAVYQVAWSADSRMLVSGSKDSTLKVWSITSNKCKENLPGHADEVYAVDWSPDGARVVSGSKDKLVRIWRN